LWVMHMIPMTAVFNEEILFECEARE